MNLRGRPGWRKPALVAGGSVVAIAGLKALTGWLAGQGLIHASTPLPVVVLGMIVGLTYGLLAVGLVLIYRSNRIINFAHGQIGIFASVFFALASERWNVPYWVCFPFALAVAAATGAAVEAGVVRRLKAAPRLMSIVATLGVAQFLVAFAFVINSKANASQLFPEPSWLPTFHLGALEITPSYSAMLFLSPIVVVGLAAFLKRSPYGLAIRAAAANPERARMSGIFSSRMSSLSWALAGSLSGFTAILIAPTEGVGSLASGGPSLMLRALTASVVARMQNLPAALATGVGIGVLEQILVWNYPKSDLVEVVLFVVIFAVLLVQRQHRGRDEEKGSWASVQAIPPLPRHLRQLPAVRLLGPGGAVAFVALLAVAPLVISNAVAQDFTLIIGFSIVGLSVGVLTGLGGQLTLGQYAVAGIGSVGAYEVFSRTGSFPLALVYGGLAGAATSVLLGVPALRIRGLMLTVTTLSFALVVPDWLLGQPWMLGTGVEPGRVRLFGYVLDTGHRYYYLALVLLVASLILARNFRRSGFSRLLVAVRDNEDNARAFTVRASVVKLQAYLFAGFVAGVGGTVVAFSLTQLDPTVFPATDSITVAVMAVLGGVSTLSGPIAGAVFVLGLPMLNIGNIGLAATDAGALLLILWKPSGISQFVVPVRNFLVNLVARGHSGPPAGPPPASPILEIEHLAARPRLASQAGDGPLLVATELGRRFGGVVAVDGVSFEVGRGETVGLIGPNGAGKTTTFEILGGFTRPDTGRVVFAGVDVTAASVERRARLGLIRSFQDAALFPTMTVEETVMLALERVDPTPFVGAAAGRSRSERDKARRAGALVGALGLHAYRDKQIQELSTGTRRITEIACLLALDPVCLLLDEPTSGIAQRETEALGQLLVDIKAQLGLTLVVIEHDIPMIMGISDRIVAMADGRVLVEGPPEAVRADPRVVESYMGANGTALARSGPAGPPATRARAGARP